MNVVRERKVLGIAFKIFLNLLAAGPLWIVAGHRKVGVFVGVSRVLRGESRIASRSGPHTTHVSLFLKNGHLIAKALECFSRAETGNSGTDYANLFCRYRHKAPLKNRR